MVELTLVAPLLALLIVGILEFGMGFRDSNAVVNANRAGARTAASQGSRGPADFYALQAVKAGLAGIDGVTIDRIVVFNATTNTQPDPACLSMTAPGGQTGARACNVYSGASLNLTATSFSSTGSTCVSPAVDRYYCPLTRSVVLGSGTDYLGVYIKLSRPTFTRIIGAALDLTDSYIVRLEPV